MRTSFDDRLEEILLEYTDANELWCNAVEEKEEDPHEIKRQEDRQQCAKQDLEQFGKDGSGVRRVAAVANNLS